tara:strand:- start:395 stop:877 length:483 start_codon:yes stop_codon:yes gene_type:complete
MSLARPLHSYLKQPNEVQIQCIVSRRIVTVEDFWLDVGHWKAYKGHYGMQGMLYKKDIINFLRTFCCGLKLDFEGMQKDVVISLHGKRPNEHFFLIPPYSKVLQNQISMQHHNEMPSSYSRDAAMDLILELQSQYLDQWLLLCAGVNFDANHANHVTQWE